MDIKKLFLILLFIGVESVLFGAAVLYLVLRGDFRWSANELSGLTDHDIDTNSVQGQLQVHGHNGVLVALIPILINITIGINIDGPDYRHTCKVISHADFIPTKSWHASQIGSVAVRNIDKCLTATNLTEYFSTHGYLHHAHTNAHHLLTALKELVPRKFIDGFNDHCWNVTPKLYHSHPAMFQLYPSGKKTNITMQRTESVQSSPNHQSFVACLPRIFLLGFEKCGSTFFYSKVASHPLVICPIRKEPKWWYMAPLTTSRNITDLLTDYLKYFMPLTKKVAQGKTHLVTIDGTPGNIYKWPGFQNEITDICLLPSIIPEILPRSKFLVIMRNPVTMLYSSFWYSCTYNGGIYSKLTEEEKLKGPDIFHRKVVAKVEQFNSCIQNSPLTKCVYDTVDNQYHDNIIKQAKFFCGHIRLSEALYFIHIQKWLSLVPRDQFLFLTLDELSENTDTVMERVWKFIGIPSHPYVKSHVKKMCHVKDEDQYNSQSKVKYHSDPHLRMKSETKQLLQDFFRPYNRRLAVLLQDSKFQNLWENSSV